MITREQIADLRPGDVIEFTDGRWLPGTVLRGPLWGQSNGALLVGDLLVRHVDGNPGRWDNGTFRIVSRVPRRLYINHPRTEPVPGDVARDEEADGVLLIFRMPSVRRGDDVWYDQDGTERTYGHLSPPRRLRLLVDGETGQAVTSGE